MAKLEVKTQLDGEPVKMVILTREDVHPLFISQARPSNIKIHDFLHYRLSQEDINKSELIIYKDSDQVVILKQKYT